MTYSVDRSEHLKRSFCITLMAHPALVTGVGKFLLCCCVLSITCGLDLPHLESKYYQHAKVLDSKDREYLTVSDKMYVVYFIHGDSYDIGSELDNGAKYLEPYNVKFLVVNCVFSTEGYCHNESLIAFQNGKEFYTFDLNTMFDIDSIMSNTLQLYLVKQVPVLEALSERKELEKSNMGKKNLIFLFVNSLGSMEHRVFMEIAYAYHDQYKFLLSTINETIMGLSDHDTIPEYADSAIWTLYCAEVSQESSDSNDCHSVLYRGVLTLSSLASYLKRLPEPNLFYAPENGTASLLEMKTDLSIIFIFTNIGLKEDSDKLSLSLSYDVKGFAKVVVVNTDDKDCLEIASKHGFDGYVPRTAVVTPDGNLTFMDRQDHLNLTEIRHFLVNAAVVPTAPSREIVKGSSKYFNKLHAEVESQDDEVANAIFNAKKNESEITHMPVVSKATFQNVIKSAKLKIVLFYLPYDALSMSFLTDFGNAAMALESERNIKDVLAVVNCYDATDLCTLENIALYPTIRIYKKNLPSQTYEGPLDMSSVIKVAALLKQDLPIELKDEAELNSFIKGEFPTKITDFTPSSVIFVAPKKDKAMWSLFRDASKQLAPFVAIGEVKGKLVGLVTKKHDCSSPSLISFHHNDPIQPVRILSKISRVEDIVTFVKQAMIPAMPELTAINFPLLHSKKLPFVILFLNQSNPKSSEIKTMISQIASMDSFHDSVFCWMDAQNKTPGMELLKEYTESNSTPTVAVVNHKQAEVFIHQSEALNSNAIVQWLTSVFSEKETPSKTLKEKKWSPPGPHYDFLSFMGDENFMKWSESESGDNGHEGVIYDDTFIKKESETREELLIIHQGRRKMDDNARPKGSENGEAAGKEAIQLEGKGHSHQHNEL